MTTQAHPMACVHATDIGPGSRVWPYVVILHGARIGTECDVCSHVWIESDVTTGDHVTIKSDLQFWDGLRRVSQFNCVTAIIHCNAATGTRSSPNRI